MAEETTGISNTVPDELANRALAEYWKSGTVSAVCPKCGEHPRVFASPEGGRIDMICPCGYFKTGEIFL